MCIWTNDPRFGRWMFHDAAQDGGGFICLRSDCPSGWTAAGCPRTQLARRLRSNND